MEGENVTSKDIEKEGSENWSQCIGGGMEWIGQTVNAAQRAAAKKVRPHNGNHDVSSAMKYAVQDRQKKDDPNAQDTVKLEAYRPIEQEKYQTISKDICCDQPLYAKPFCHHPPCQRSHRSGNGNCAEK